MDATERALLEETLRDAMAGASAGSPGAAVDRILVDLGWFEMLDAEAPDAVDAVFHTLGQTGCTAAALDDVVVHALGSEPRADLAVLLPGFGAAAPPGALERDRLAGRGIATRRLAEASELLVVAAAGSELHAVAVPSSHVEVRRIEGLDPDAGYHAARVDHVAASTRLLAAGAWESAIAAGRLALARQIAGASRTMLELARTHATERVQFDRPIARFQAVRHRLAEALVAVEALDAAVEAARDEPGPMTAALAKAVAGRNARTVATHCQQVLAGIGFTTDHPFHRFLKRTMVLDGLFGSADAITIDLGRELLASRHVPTLIDL